MRAAVVALDAHPSGQQAWVDRRHPGFRTAFAIAHRMVTAATADRVLVLDAGRLVQAGPHDELLAQEGPYAGLFAAWAR